MRISEMLKAIASWLESPNNEALMLAEYDDDCSKVVAENCVLAAELLKNAAEQVDSLEPPEESKLTPESLQGLADIATAFDSSGDEELKKQASVIDELLLTIAAPPNAYAARKDLEENRITELQKKYKSPGEDLYKTNSVADSEKKIEKSKITKYFNILESPLSTRYCPDHAGVQIARIGENLWQCELDKKSYDFQSGFELNNGNKVPGGDIAHQTKGVDNPSYTVFDTREGRLGANR